MRILEKRRTGYKRTYRDKHACDFCDASVLRDQEVKVLRGEHWMVLACKYPYLNGNLMILPKRHVTHTDKLNAQEWAEFPKVLLATQKILGDLFKTKSFNIALNLGPNSGGTIRHIHWMIVPRPKKLNPAAFNVLHGFYLVQMDHKQLIDLIDQAAGSEQV